MVALWSDFSSRRNVWFILFFLSVILFAPVILSGQSGFKAMTPEESLGLKLETLNTGRLDLNRTGMLVLNGWAILNILVGSILYFRSTGVSREFWLMNALWNVINVAIATFAILGSGADAAVGLSLAESLKEQVNIEKILLFNGGLDVGYIMAGFYLRERSRFVAQKWRIRLRGWGNAIVIQGAFLFVFDIVMAVLHTVNGNKGVWKIIAGL